MFNTYQDLGLILGRLMINYIDELAKVQIIIDSDRNIHFVHPKYGELK